MSYKPNTYIDDVAFKQAFTDYNNNIKETYADIPKEDTGVDTRYLIGVANSSGAGDANSSLYKSSSLKYSEADKKLETPNISAGSVDIAGSSGTVTTKAVTIGPKRDISVIGAVDTSAEIADFNADTPAEI